jgi:ferredoxin-type protein NapG
MSGDRPINRRRFFREGLVELVKKLQDVAKPLADAAKQFGDLAGEELTHSTPAYSYTPPTQKDWLRPPGALPEDQFTSQCTRSGECVRVCPVQAIQIDYSGENGGGAPYVDAEAIACVLCDGLLCMAACPSGALVRTEKDQINMGLAVWHEESCLRTVGQPCTVCVDRCPVGPAAIQVTEGKIHVSQPGCTGCGVCQHDCPTYPRSIRVAPRSVAAMH